MKNFKLGNGFCLQGFSLAAVVGAVLMASGSDIRAQEWTRFRGPNGTGIAAAGTSIPAVWTPETIQWKIPLEGGSHSSPVLWGDHLFVSRTDEDGSVQVLVCVDAVNGRVQWERPFRSQSYRIHQYNSLASPTPAVTSDRVFFTWGNPDGIQLAALDHSGKLLWTRDLGTFSSQHGYANSPIVEGNRVIIAKDHLGESFLAAYHVDTGEEIWKLERRAGDHTAYSTPCLFEPENGKPYLIFNSSSHGITGIDPETGNVLWEKGGLFDKRSVSSPVFSKNLIFGSCGSGGGGNYVVAISVPDADAPEESPELVYRFRRSAPYVPTPVVNGDRAVFLSDQGIVSLIDLKTGDTVYSERTNERFFGSPVLVGEYLFAASTDGDMVVFKAGDEFEIVAVNSLGSGTHSTPAVANNRMYVRTGTHLYCIGE